MSRSIDLGSLLSGGGSGPKNKDDYTLKGWTDLVDGYQKHALKTRLAIPLLYGIDAVHGHNNVPGAVIFPHDIGLGCTRDAVLVEKVERVTAEEVRATGINWVFAPCVTVPQDERWGRTYEGFSEDPRLVAELGAAAVRGFQGARLSDPLSAASWPAPSTIAGDGGTAYGTAFRTRSSRDGRPRFGPRATRRCRRGHASARPPDGLRLDHPGRRRYNHAVVQQLERREVLGPTSLPAHGNPVKRDLGFDGKISSSPDYANAIDQISPGDFYKKDVENRRSTQAASTW